MHGSGEQFPPGDGAEELPESRAPHRVIGTPPPGTNSDKTLLTLDWRFKRNWSMEATFGDQGSSIMDFVWRYRY